MNLAFVFPGQGSQSVGMGRELAEAMPAARHTFEEVDEALKQNLSRLIFEGPEEELILTENAQPALMAVSLAVIRVLEQEAGLKLGEACAFVAGHSMGEYSALAAARAFTLDAAARLLKRRGQAMQRAVPVGEGAMAALIGIGLAEATELAEAEAGDEVCAVANDNAPDQVVVSGSRAAVERVAERMGRRAIMLPVSAPFHSPLMEPAAEEIAEALEGITMAPPMAPLVANVTASAVSDPDTIRGLLIEQVTAMVRWRESVLYLKDHGVDTVVEIGAGKVLSGLTRRIDPELDRLTLGAPDDIDAFVKRL